MGVKIALCHAGRTENGPDLDVIAAGIAEDLEASSAILFYR